MVYIKVKYVLHDIVSQITCLIVLCTVRCEGIAQQAHNAFNIHAIVLTK